MTISWMILVRWFELHQAEPPYERRRWELSATAFLYATVRSGQYHLLP